MSSLTAGKLIEMLQEVSPETQVVIWDESLEVYIAAMETDITAVLTSVTQSDAGELQNRPILETNKPYLYLHI